MSELRDLLARKEDPKDKINSKKEKGRIVRDIARKVPTPNTKVIEDERKRKSLNPKYPKNLLVDEND